MSLKTTVYFNKNCLHCINLKSWLEKNNIQYHGLNTEDPEVIKVLVHKGVTGVPFTVIEDDERKTREEIIGFNEKKFKSIFIGDSLIK